MDVGLSLILFFLVTEAHTASTSGVDGDHATRGPDFEFFFTQQQIQYPRDCGEIKARCSSSNYTGVYIIKPDGYPDPFEVYCDMADDLRWTLILQRSVEDTIGFNRDWIDYKNGFGFLSNGFWIGNEKLSYLTNQKQYQLSFKMYLSNGSEVAVSYNYFRVGDEFSDYELFRVSKYFGRTDSISWCPSNMVYGNCTCGQRLCQDPNTCLNTCREDEPWGCICPGEFYMEGEACAPKYECGCYISEDQTVIPEEEIYVNANCTMVATCINGQLSWNGTYQCSPNASCGERNGERKCHCNEGFTGDGELCQFILRTDCMDLYNAGITNSGVYTIEPTDWPGSPFRVYCNMTDEGGWTVFQRRIDGDVDFYLGWDSYKEGFGDVEDEHWLGNEQLYYLTNQRSYQLRIDLVNKYGAPFYAKFASFRINNEADKYRLLDLGSYSGTADKTDGPYGYALTYHQNRQFGTKDDNSCAVNRHGAWWYNNCAWSNLNGNYHGPTDEMSSIQWHYLPGNDHNIKYVEMKIRPV